MVVIYKKYNIQYIFIYMMTHLGGCSSIWEFFWFFGTFPNDVPLCGCLVGFPAGS